MAAFKGCQKGVQKYALFSIYQKDLLKKIALANPLLRRNFPSLK